MLSTNLNVDSVGDPKFSVEVSNNADAAISPTTTLRKIMNILAKVGLSLCFRSTFVIISISRKGSKITEKEAKNAPSTPIYSG